MNCRKVRRRLAAGAGAELEPRLAQHLDRCPACRAEAAAQARLTALLDDQPAADAKPELWAGAEQRLAAGIALPLARRSLRPLWLGGAAAAAVLLVVLAWPSAPPAAPDSEFMGQHQVLANAGPLTNGALGDLLTATATEAR